MPGSGFTATRSVVFASLALFDGANVSTVAALAAVEPELELDLGVVKHPVSFAMKLLMVKLLKKHSL
jgi:hypothetical protein